ncbi:MAG: RNA polymerase sigma factor [Ktedonobacteraceae bacterium]
MTMLTMPMQMRTTKTSVQERIFPLASDGGAESIEAFQQGASDEDLIAAICLGAEWAIEILYQRYHRYAYALAYRVLHESNGTEDVVQEVFLSIWRKAATYQQQHGGVYGWLQAIVHHRAIDKIRSASYRDHQCKPLEEEGVVDIPSTQPEVWEEAWHEQQRGIIRAVLAQLPVEQREVIELAYFDGHTHAEIAEQKNIPLGTVKGRMRLGLQKRRHLMQEYGLDSGW